MSRSPVFRTTILGASIAANDRVVNNGVISFAGKIIDFLGSKEEWNHSPKADESSTVIDGYGMWVLPGFVDIHVHGGYGHDFMDANKEAYDTITRFHAAGGTTTMLATTVTSAKPELDRVLAATAAYRNGGDPMPGAKLAGVHLEGPFLSPLWSGAQNPAHMVSPRQDWLAEWTEAYPGLIRLVTLAPEREGALAMITWLNSQGITAAAGHTDASYDQIKTAADAGLSHSIHTFNAMRGLHHREPGTVGAVLEDNRITAEVIADGHHVHPSCIRLLAQAKGPGKLVLITDAIAASGLGNGDYKLGDLDVVMAGGVARLRDGGALAGSTLTMIEAFHYAVTQVGISVADASKAASSNPARVLGLADETGSLAVGKRADALLLKPDWTIRRVWIDGRELAR